MEQLLLIGSSETNGNQCTLALPSDKWFQRLRNDGLPNPPIIPLEGPCDCCERTYPELVIAGAVMRRKYETCHVSPNIRIEGKSINSHTYSKTMMELVHGHPMPRNQGPLRMPEGCDKLRSRTLFSHHGSQSCALWVPSVEGVSAWSDHQGGVTYNVMDEVPFKIDGAAMTRNKRSMIYTCTFFGCVIECPCSICVSKNVDCKLRHITGLCSSCNPQCKVHEIKVPHMFDATSDQYTLVTDDIFLDKYRYAFGYSGIPKSCQDCSQDLREHQIYHLIYHFFCRFCKFELRPLELLKNDYSMSYENAVKRIERFDDETCSVCLNHFKDKYARVKHENTVHSDQPQKFKCDHCTKSYASESTLRYHLSKKHQESVQKYPCDLCGLELATPATLLRHTKHVHEKDSGEIKKFSCESCGQMFSLLSNMKRHQRELHFGPKYNFDFDEGLVPSKKFHCEACEKKFIRRTDLKRHILSIHSEHSYSCTQCDLKFGRKDILIRHIKAKHSENDHVCETCDASFSRNEDLGRHVRTVHSEKVNTCQHCEKKFGRADSLKRHMKSVHSHMQ